MTNIETQQMENHWKQISAIYQPIFEKQLKGLSFDEAISLVKPLGFTIRVVKNNDEYRIGTGNFRVDRINVELVNNVIEVVIGVG